MVKHEILDKCRNILYNRISGYPLNESDTEFLMTLFPLHPKFKEKVAGRIIKAIIVKKHPTYHNKCFALVFTDNTTTEISFTECVNRTGLKEDIQAACFQVIPGVDSKIINEWIKTFENRELSLGLYLDYSNLSCPSFNNNDIINNFQAFVIEKTQSRRP